MHRTLLYFIISTFLFAAFSNEAYGTCPEASDSTAWLMRAVACERIAFSTDDPEEANEALVRKASCYVHAGKYKEASSTLERVSMYLLSPEKQEDVLCRKEICSYLCGDFEAAEAAALQRNGGVSNGEKTELQTLAEQLRSVLENSPERKSELTATILAFLPPLGQFYTHNYREGVKAGVLNWGAAAWTVCNCMSGDWITGLLGGGIVLSHTFMGNQDQSMEMVFDYNASLREDARRRMEEILKKMIFSFNIFRTHPSS